jgi:hypothetical protein
LSNCGRITFTLIKSTQSNLLTNSLSIFPSRLVLPIALTSCNAKAKSIWDGVIEKIEHRLASWKMMYLFEGERITLIKSTLFNLPTNFLSLFSLRTSVANRIDKLQREFLWSRLGEEFKYYLVSWSKVCSSISKGGLGVRNLLLFNRALLRK